MKKEELLNKLNYTVDGHKIVKILPTGTSCKGWAEAKVVDKDGDWTIPNVPMNVIEVYEALGLIDYSYMDEKYGPNNI